MWRTLDPAKCSLLWLLRAAGGESQGSGQKRGLLRKTARPWEAPEGQDEDSASLAYASFLSSSQPLS